MPTTSIPFQVHQANCGGPLVCSPPHSPFRLCHPLLQLPWGAVSAMRSAFILLVLMFATVSGQAVAEKRVALVIGNSAYQHAVQLANPKNDSSDIAAKLQSLGFQVVSD